MSYVQRLSMFMVIDTVIILTAILLGGFLVSPTFSVFAFPIMISSLSILLSHYLYSYIFKFYRKSWEYASIGELIIIFKVALFTLLTAGGVQQIFFQQIHFRFLAVTCLLHLLLIGGSRFCWRIYRDRYLNRVDKQKRTLIIGAGSAGAMVARQLLKSKDAELLPVAFIDDDVKKQQLDILGVPVFGGIYQFLKVIEDLNIEHVIIAIPSLNKRRLNTIFQECAKTNVKTQILPKLEDIVSGKISVNQFRDVQVEDLLGREPVDLDLKSISKDITNKVVLVTGAGGSIGSEICRQISQFNPKQLVLLGHGENSIYSIELELKERFRHEPIEFLTEIADLQDEKKMMLVMSTYQPNVVYHAAAHKHVPLMERNPEEAVKNNIIGTGNVAEAASWHGVETFVMISTDKAVNPTSVMGASKRLAEMVIQDLNQKSKTKFVTVRFGNVLGSRGSVIPLFKQQIRKGGPITITHPDMIRYFMTIPEASRLVIQASALANGGEIFVLDMGEPVKIVDLATNLIQLSGYSSEEIEIAFTGIRPGEKLFEELLKADEIHEQQVYPNIYVGKTAKLYSAEIEELIATYSGMDRVVLKERLIDLANNNLIPEALPLMSYSG
ncbi:polysaccharide biosynthesis protein [Bacillus sp. SD088]|uniref:polysaccharide biosynthesis protein n=1 Tax=Bacillus sp. SD088 TaxID=2782012 RepID=UPI001A97707B|nr:nucleoside-diphosphate sugar epimerase/dehydratase [Bacillus sp. SD088]MBO0992529.1 polysaccharide biosynthesis protein [Bacillus sp. SD088]